METIIGVGFKIPSNEDDYLAFDTKGSLSDADIVVFNPDLRNTYYSSDYDKKTFQGKRLYDIDTSFKIKENSNHWHNEFLNALNAGKIIFVTLTEKIDFYINTGKKKVSGTGVMSEYRISLIYIIIINFCLVVISILLHLGVAKSLPILISLAVFMSVVKSILHSNLISTHVMQ